MTVTLRGSCVRMALMDLRTELIRCASIAKYDTQKRIEYQQQMMQQPQQYDATFDRMIQELDDALFQLRDWKTIELKETV